MNARFYAPDAHAPGDVVTLSEEEGTHLTRVLRLGTGDSVRVFSGTGLEFGGVVEHATKSGVRVRLGERCEAAAEAKIAVTLAQSVLKGDKMDDVIRDAVMLGVAMIQPVVATRSEVTVSALERGNRRDRWHRVAIAAAKQSGRAVVPTVSAICAFEKIPQAIATRQLPVPALFLVEPGASSEAIAFSELDIPAMTEATIVVGPEGGWTPDEIEMAASCCTLVRLGRRTLRADAVPVIALAALFTRWKEF